MPTKYHMIFQKDPVACRKIYKNLKKALQQQLIKFML